MVFCSDNFMLFGQANRVQSVVQMKIFVLYIGCYVAGICFNKHVPCISEFGFLLAIINSDVRVFWGSAEVNVHKLNVKPVILVFLWPRRIMTGTSCPVS